MSLTQVTIGAVPWHSAQAGGRSGQGVDPDPGPRLVLIPRMLGTKDSHVCGDPLLSSEEEGETTRSCPPLTSGREKREEEAFPRFPCRAGVTGRCVAYLSANGFLRQSERMR